MPTPNLQSTDHLMMLSLAASWQSNYVDGARDNRELYAASWTYGICVAWRSDNEGAFDYLVKTLPTSIYNIYQTRADWDQDKELGRIVKFLRKLCRVRSESATQNFREQVNRAGVTSGAACEVWRDKIQEDHCKGIWRSEEANIDSCLYESEVTYCARKADMNRDEPMPEDKFRSRVFEPQKCLLTLCEFEEEPNQGASDFGASFTLQKGDLKSYSTSRWQVEHVFDRSKTKDHGLENVDSYANFIMAWGVWNYHVSNSIVGGPKSWPTIFEEKKIVYTESRMEKTRKVLESCPVVDLPKDSDVRDLLLGWASWAQWLDAQGIRLEGESFTDPWAEEERLTNLLIRASDAYNTLCPRET